MKDTNDTTELDNLLEDINNLSEEDAKSFLKIIHGYLDILENGDGTFTKKQFIEKISVIYKNKIPTVVKIRKEKNSK